MPSRPHLPRPHQHDVVIGLGGLFGGALMWALGLQNNPSFFHTPRWLGLIALLVVSATELVRRSRPLIGLGVGTVALAVDILSGGLAATMLMYTDLVYAAVVYSGATAAQRVPRICWLLTGLVTVVPLAVYNDPLALLAGAFVGLLVVTPAWTGTVVRNHREEAQAARLETERVALLAELDRREAVASERSRMARELHDMVANHLSAIAIHSSAALSLKDPAATDEALGVIRENSVRGLAEMRRLIGLLRDPGETSEPAATSTLDALDTLLEQARANARPGGQDIVLCDERPDGAAPLPAPVELAAYRIVQESLTNALKHAAPGRVDVTLAHRADGPLEVSVISPYGDRDGPRAPGSGTGLIGMRERVSLLGGTLDAGPVPGPGGTVWQVRAALPLGDESAQSLSAQRVP
ncbi:sensor histidine kinase [Streptomyces rapamycinicus]|uniref:histidine kinase n=1 Tax=Streptomyces rapamycinicus (strain ATCC 29253 / DSM 41530 / NRRL 5491 / AYB-994) TaxID=1343740 RepID=A0A3L8RQV6_STRRN|nr:histidine kinase [Streptomyces rapamycinicus]RLV82017.1 chitinase [Streptomyces rapamycinicus NRRL 5491]UTO63006.1 histidine kinase [Streptomyces rapamycinicus]UTP30964.1 histidine kinase [Streptomyces rapamycinicus NRRL 5491]